jgi:hypothetical protein
VSILSKQLAGADIKTIIWSGIERQESERPVSCGGANIVKYEQNIRRLMKDELQHNTAIPRSE